MFRSAPAAEPAPVDQIVADDLIPISHLELDLPAPATGWLIELDRRGISIVADDLGRLAVTRDSARQLFDEHRENEARKREAAQRQEQAAIEADRQFRARLPRGTPWYAFPDSVSPAEAWRAAELAAQPKRRSVLEEALANEGTLTYHALPKGDDS
jgi:hypothetical protein